MKKFIMLLKFILNNKKSFIYNNIISVFVDIFIKEKNVNDLNFTEENKRLFIQFFITNNISFNKNTPDFIINDIQCIKCALDRDTNNINFIKDLNPTLEKYVIEKLLEYNFIIKEDSPCYLKNNFKIAINSIKLDVKSADYVNWNLMSNNHKDILINELINSQYILSSISHPFLSNNPKIIYSSVEKDNNSIKYIGKNISSNTIMFKYLLLNGYNFNNEQILNMELSAFSDIDVLGSCFKQIGVYGNDNKKYIANFNKVFYDAIMSRPLIKTFDSIFQIAANESWNIHKKMHFDEYDNISGKICAELKFAKNFNNAITEIVFLPRMQTVLEEKYINLHEAMKEYFEIFHNEKENKLQKIESSRNVIYKLSALYVAKCKEKHKKEIIEDGYKYIRKYFTLKTDNQYISKKLIYASKKEKFNQLYQAKDDDVYHNFIDKLYKKYCNEYEKEINPYIIYHMMLSFITSDYEKINQMIRIPNKYEMYIRYEKATKLFHRLNSGYIAYDGPEVLNYRNIISFNDNSKKYFYSGMDFDDKDIYAYNKYRKTMRVFDMIKKDINSKIKSINEEDYINTKILQRLTYELPFSDDYFVFSTTDALKQFNLKDLKNATIDSNFGFNLTSFTNDELFTNIYDLMVNKSLIWILLFSYKNRFLLELDDVGIDKDNIIEIIDDIEDIANFAKNLQFNINNCSELLLAHKLYKYADTASVAILGKNITENLCKYTEYTDQDEEAIIKIAKEFVCEMVKRNNSTVPYIEGSTDNYHYSMYDTQDNTILLAGINTDACFKINGNDNDFLHYCALDKNGFVIKITDLSDNFIARAAGFRNGNCVFINQLRTIYDESGDYYCGGFDNERDEIIETFEKACFDIVNTSQKNYNEKDKIDFVFVTQSYSMECCDSNVSDSVETKIGDEPMDNESDDWYDFLDICSNLQETNSNEAFYTDYGDYPLICMASVKDIKCIKPDDIKRKDVEAIYKRKRNKVIITNTFTDDLCQKINKITAIKAYFDKKDFIPLSLSNKNKVCIGDNWYIIYDGNKIIDYCLLEFDSEAVKEFKLVKDNIINNSFEYNFNNVKFDYLIETNNNNNNYTKILKK